MKLSQLDDAEKRKAAKEAEKEGVRKPVILTPGKSITIELPEKRKSHSVEEYQLQRRQENAALRNGKCPECLADVTIDCRGSNIFWYTCQKFPRHTYIRVGQLPSVTEDEMIAQKLAVNHNLD